MNRELWDLSLEDMHHIRRNRHGSQLIDKEGKVVRKVMKNIQGKRIRVWNSIQAGWVTQKGGIPIDAWTEEIYDPEKYSIQALSKKEV